MLGALKKIFVNDDGSADAAAKAGATATAEPEAAEEAPARSATPSRGGSGRSGRGSRATEDDSSSDEAADDSILANLNGAIEDAKGAGFGYFEFRESLANMEKSVPDESARYKAAGGAAKAMKCSPSKLISSAQDALKVLDGEESVFKTELAKAADLDEQKNTELADVQKQIKSLEGKRDKLTSDLESSGKKLESSKKKFTTAKNSLAKAIEKDIENIQEYLSK